MSEIKQETINKLFVLMTEVTESITESVRENISKMEDSGDKDKFMEAQKAKILCNDLDHQTNKMRNEYPHLFKDNLKGANR